MPEHRRRLREAKDEAMVEAVPVYGTDPVDALQEVLDSSVALMRVARQRAGELEGTELFRDTMVGPIPNEWIRLEKDLRNEVAFYAGRMIGLDIAGRRARVAEVLAEALAPALDGILRDLRLTPAQRRKAPKVVRQHLEALEGTGREITERAAA